MEPQRWDNFPSDPSCRNDAEQNTYALGVLRCTLVLFGVKDAMMTSCGDLIFVDDDGYMVGSVDEELQMQVGGQA